MPAPRRPSRHEGQSDGCAPIAVAFEKGERFARKFENAAIVASGLRVPAAVGDFMILDAIRESGGSALAAPEGDIPKWMQLAASQERVAFCPETAVCLRALEILLRHGAVKPTERILVFNTGASQKYPEAVQEKLPRLDVTQVH
jgi:threonine synthase